MDTAIIEKSELKLFSFSTKQKLILTFCTLILWLGALIAYLSPGFDYWFISSFDSLRADPFFASFWYYYTVYMLYLIQFPLLILYLASFKLNRLKPYRLVIFLALAAMAIGNPLVDPLFKDFFGRPRPWMTYPDINSLYYVSGLSFPSGHAFQSFASTLPFIICFLTNDSTFKRNWKKSTLTFILLIIASTLAFSRVLAGVHYISDVLAGIGFAIILIVILASLIQWLLDKGKLNLQNEKWYAIIVIGLILFYSIFLPFIPLWN